MGYTPSFTPQYENGWENLPSETSPITAEAFNAYDDAIENIEDYLASDESQANLADAYDETATYEAGDYVICGGDLYKCLEDIDEPEEWDSTKWESCLITDEMATSGGTTVIANPSGEATDTLTKLQVAETIYGISGGGGNANIWTGTQAELEEVFDELEEGTQINITDDEQEVVDGGTIYSEEEQVIGLWTDNRPLYQRTVKVTGLARATSSTIAISASDLADLGISSDEVIEMDFALDYYVSGALTKFTQNTYLNSTSLVLVWAAGGNIYYWAQWGSTSTGISIDLTLTFKYTKSTDAPLDAVVGKRTMYIASSDCYSTEEKEIGCHVDGKPLYQKTYISSSDATLTNSSWVTIFTLSNVDEVIQGEIIRKTANNDYIGVSCNAMVDSSGNVKYQVAHSSLVCKSGSIYTLQYTKTTDTAGSGSYTPASGKAVHYSTDEQVIGTWIDGSTLYEKTISGTSAPDLNTLTIIAELPTDCRIKEIKGLIDGTRELNSWLANDNRAYTWIAQNGYQVANWAVGSNYASKSTLVTVRYTKVSS